MKIILCVDFYTPTCNPYPTQTRVTPSASPLNTENWLGRQLLHSADVLANFRVPCLIIVQKSAHALFKLALKSALLCSYSHEKHNLAGLALGCTFPVLKAEVS